jgi:hypothetical protein
VTANGGEPRNTRKTRKRKKGKRETRKRRKEKGDGIWVESDGWFDCEEGNHEIRGIREKGEKGKRGKKKGQG